MQCPDCHADLRGDGSCCDVCDWTWCQRGMRDEVRYRSRRLPSEIAAAIGARGRREWMAGLRWRRMWRGDFAHAWPEGVDLETSPTLCGKHWQRGFKPLDDSRKKRPSIRCQLCEALSGSTPGQQEAERGLGVSDPDYEDLDSWQELCEFLDARKGKCAYQDSVPGHLRHLVYKGGNARGKAVSDARFRVGVIFYQAGHGWRLSKSWKERMERWRSEGLRSLEQAREEYEASR